MSNNDFSSDAFALDNFITCRDEGIEGNIFVFSERFEGRNNPESIFSLETCRRKISRVAQHITWVIEVGVNGDHNELIDQCE